VSVHQRERRGRHDLVERLPGGKHAALQQRELVVGDSISPRVGFFDQQIGILERRFEDRRERIEVRRQHVHRSDEVHDAPDPCSPLHRKLRVAASGCAGATAEYTMMNETTAPRAGRMRRSRVMCDIAFTGCGPSPKLPGKSSNGRCMRMGRRQDRTQPPPEISNQVGHRESARLAQHASDRERARRVRQLRLAAAEPAERCGQNAQLYLFRL